MHRDSILIILILINSLNITNFKFKMQLLTSEFVIVKFKIHNIQIL